MSKVPGLVITEALALNTVNSLSPASSQGSYQMLQQKSPGLKG